jgi:CBS domain-containing membrane protein
MTCARIMNDAHPRLREDSSLEEAWLALEQSGVTALPVVDSTGRYLGVFTQTDFFRLALPKAAAVEGGLSDLAFASETVDDLRRRLRHVRGEKVRNNLDPATPSVRPGTSVVEAVLHFSRGFCSLPVVDENSGRLLGVISASSLLTELAPRD